MLSAICFSLDQSTILSSGNGLKGYLASQVISRLDARNKESIVPRSEGPPLMSA